MRVVKGTLFEVKRGTTSENFVSKGFLNSQQFLKNFCFAEIMREMLTVMDFKQSLWFLTKKSTPTSVFFLF